MTIGNMAVNFMGFAVPFFLFFIALEYYLAKKTGRAHYFKFASSIANLNVGIAERLIDMFTAAGFYFFYDYLNKKFGIFDIQPSVLLWIALLLATDFMWYWYHRMGHEVNLFWGFHVVHHTSEEFNYTAATRITIFQAIVRTGFWSILPILGFPAHMISIILIVHGVYPFFTHTRLVGKLGLLEYIMVTPSHHRVHHASNEEYLDKNYGDMFIIWDKLFGTFKVETVEPVYGLTKQLNSYSFLWQHFHYLVELGYAMKTKKGLWNKIKVLFDSPSNFDPEMREIAEKRFVTKSKVPTVSAKFKNYVIGQMVVVFFMLFGLLLFEHSIPVFLQVMCALFLLVTLTNSGAIMEQRRWVIYLEYVRAALVVVTLYYYFPDSTLTGLAVLLGIGAIIYFSSLQERYLHLVYGSGD